MSDSHTAVRRGSGDTRLVVTGWALLALLVCGSALPHLDGLGLYYDEAFLAQQARDFVEPERAGVHPGSVRSIVLLGRPFPTRNAAYLGSLKSQLLIPPFAVFGASPQVLRGATLATGLVALLLTMLFAERIFGRSVALLGGALVASDPSFVFFSQFEWGPFTTNLLCRSAGLLLATVAWQTPRRGRALAAAAGAGAALGLGVFSRADFVVILGALALALLLAHRSLVTSAMRDRTGLVATAGVTLAMCSAPMVLSSLALLSTSGAISDRGDLAFRAGVLWHVLDGSQFMRLMEVGGLFDQAGKPDLFGSAFGWLLIAATAFVAASWASRRVPGSSNELPNGSGFLLLATVGIVLGMLCMPGAVRAHHQLNSMPLTQLLVAVAVITLWRAAGGLSRMRTPARVAITCVLLVVVVANVAQIALTWRLIEATGGRGRWSHALTEFATELDAEPGATVVSLDWGFHEPLLFLTNLTDPDRLIEPIWAIPKLLRGGRPFVYEGNASTVYLVHDAPYDLFGLGPELLSAARNHRPNTPLITAHRDAQGEPAFYSIRVPMRHRLVYTGVFRFYDLEASNRTARPSSTSRSETSNR